MSLATIMEIGNKIRNELKKEESLEFHRYVKKAPLSDPKQFYTYFQIDVTSSFELDYSTLKQITDESVIKNKYYYLKFKTGEADSLVKYVFGDIAFPDFFKLGDPSNGAAAFRVNSFLRGKEDVVKIKNEKLISFRNSLEKNLQNILELFADKGFCYIHFNFSGKAWYETELFEIIENAIVSNFIKEENGFISLTAFLTRTLIDTDGRLPNFDSTNTYKTKQFNNFEEVKDLLYGLDFQQKNKVTAGKEIMINMLPKGNLTARGIIRYFDKKSQVDYKNPTPANLDPFFEPCVNPDIENIEKYDIIFSKRSKPIGIDLLEITDVDQNLLKDINNKIQKAKKELDYKYSIGFALKILFDEKKYTNHLLKILPLIYKNSYYTDDVLLPALIQKIEYSIRHGEGTYNAYYKHFYFLTKLQLKDTVMEIKESQSYLLGQMLGQMSEPFAAWRNDCPIKSFEKSYVGNLSRRIANLNDVVEFANYLNEKITIHQKGYPSIKKAYLELIKTLDTLKSVEKYNRHYCALGFFETYYHSVKEDSQIINQTEL